MPSVCVVHTVDKISTNTEHCGISAMAEPFVICAVVWMILPYLHYLMAFLWSPYGSHIASFSNVLIEVFVTW